MPTEIRHLHFWKECLQKAWAGSWALANNFGATAGGLCLLFAAWRLGLTMDAPTSVQGAIGFTLVATAVSIVLVWTIIFAVRFVLQPARLHHTVKIERDQLSAELQSIKSASPLEILYDPESNEMPFVQNHLYYSSSNGVFYYEKKIDGSATYAIAIRNNLHDKTIYSMEIEIDGDDIVRCLPLAQGFRPRDIHPCVTQMFLLLTLSPNFREESIQHDPNQALNKIGNFTIRARAKDTKESVARFRYDPDAMPQIVKLS